MADCHAHFKTISPRLGGDPNVAAVHPWKKLGFNALVHDKAVRNRRRPYNYY